GLIWVIFWLKIYPRSSSGKRTAAEEKEYSMPMHGDENPAEEKKQIIPWLSLFSYRKVWGLMVIKFLTDAGWYFFIFWLPKYLNDVRGLNIQQIGAYAWIPYAFAGGGSLIGGWLSSFLIGRKVSLDLSRKIPMAIAAALLPASLLITHASLSMAIVFFSMAMFGHQ